MACEWRLLDQHILTFPFIALVLRNELVYHFIRDMVIAFNTRHEQFVMGEDIGAIAISTLPTDTNNNDNDNNDGNTYHRQEEYNLRKANMKTDRNAAKTENSLEQYNLPVVLQRMK